MITRILLSLLAACAIAIVVLALLLHRANGQVADMEKTIATRDAMAEEAMRSADALIASYDKERESKVNPDAYANKEALYAAAKHVVGPGAPLSRAVDLFVPGQEGGSYDKGALCYLAGVMEAAARSIDIKIRWGGDFDRDGVLLEKGTFHDLPHFELDQP